MQSFKTMTVKNIAQKCYLQNQSYKLPYAVEDT